MNEITLGDTVDMERAELFKKVLDALNQYGEGSEQHQAASEAFTAGVETYIGELYERAEESLLKNNLQPTNESEEFFSRTPALLRMIGLKEYHLFGGPDNSFTLTDAGEMRKLKVGSAV